MPDDREEHGARILSQKPFPDRPKKKKKKKRKRKRAGYDASWSDEDVDGEGDKEDEDESEVGSDGGGEEEEEHENGAGGSSNDEEKRGERYGAFEIATETANELPKLCLADLPLLLPPKKRGGPGGIGKLAKRFWDCTFPLAAIQLVVEKVSNMCYGFEYRSLVIFKIFPGSGTSVHNKIQPMGKFSLPPPPLYTY